MNNENRSQNKVHNSTANALKQPNNLIQFHCASQLFAAELDLSKNDSYSI